MAGMTGSHLKVVFGLKLKHLRLKRELSLKELASNVGLSPSYLNEIERGKKHPKPEKVERLAEALGVTYNELVSSKFDRSQVHYESLLNSPALKKIPFHLFGLTLEDIVALIPDAKNEGQALVKALIEVARGYDLRVENFFHIALRCYQEMHKNFFPEIESVVADYRRSHGWSTSSVVSLAELVSALRKDFGVLVDELELDRTKYLKHVRSALVERDGREVLLVHRQYNESQKAFLVLREIGFRLLEIEDRGGAHLILKTRPLRGFGMHSSFRTLPVPFLSTVKLSLMRWSGFFNYRDGNPRNFSR